MGNPPAHRRLIPRVPKPEAKREEDLEVTAQRVIEIEVGSDIDLPRQIGDQDETTIRPSFAEPDDFDDYELTSQREPVYEDLPLPPPSSEVYDEFNDDVDAAETSMNIARPSPPQRDSLVQRLAERVPQFDDAVDPNAFSDSEPTSLKAATSSLGAEDRPMTRISPAEIGLLAAMAEGHEASRMVYMKWLEKRGEVVRAEFLRVDAALAQMSPEDPRYAATRNRLFEIAPRIGLDWRSRVSRSLIEGCDTTTGRCPSYWRALPSDNDDARNCNVCGADVFYCMTIDLARSRVAAGQRVAIDMTVARSYGDLEAHGCTTCGMAVPAQTRFCPHCGCSQG